MDTVDVVVPIPAMVEASTPRTRRGHVGWAWIPTAVSVPVLSSDATVVLVDPEAWVWPDADARTKVHGACAGGRHWRTPGTVLHRERRRDAATPSEGPSVFFGDRVDGGHTAAGKYPTLTRWDPMGSDGAARTTSLRETSREISIRRHVTRGVQANFQRAMKVKEDEGTDASQPMRRWRMRSDARWNLLEPDLHAALVTEAASSLAVVDGVPMEASPPPVRTVVLDADRGGGPVVTVVDGYPDAVEAFYPSRRRPVQAVFPFGADWVVEEVRAAVWGRRAFQGAKVVDMTADADGAVVTPWVGFEPLSRDLVHRTIRCAPSAGMRDDTVADLEPHVREATTHGTAARERLRRVFLDATYAPSDAVRRSEYDWSLLRRVLDFKSDVASRHELAGPVYAEPAPDVLDAVSFAP